MTNTTETIADLEAALETATVNIAKAEAAGLRSLAQSIRRDRKRIEAKLDAARTERYELELATVNGDFSAREGLPRAAAASPFMVNLLKGRPVGEPRTVALLKAWNAAYQARCDLEAAAILEEVAR